MMQATQEGSSTEETEAKGVGSWQVPEATLVAMQRTSNAEAESWPFGCLFLGCLLNIFGE